MIGGRQKSWRDENVQARPDRQSRRDRHPHRPGGRVARGSNSVAVFTPADALSLHTKLAGKAQRDRRRRRPGARPISTSRPSSPRPGKAAATASIPATASCRRTPTSRERCQAEGLALHRPLARDAGAVRRQGRGARLRPGAGHSRRPRQRRRRSASGADAKALARSIGYPVMLKASAGGGGRGMRAVTRRRRRWTRRSRAARARPRRRSATARCSSRSSSPRPRHIEVQVLGDGQGNVVHLFERDCSVQLRHQKVVEIAPGAGPRRRRCASASWPTPSRWPAPRGYVNAGTVEFLVDPETGEHFFIECNPRIQVEHTVTEQVTGVDLVEAQFRIAAGESLAALGLADQKAVGSRAASPCRRASWPRAPARSAPTSEPSGPGVRVDACGYLGLAPPPQFDPLLAKLIGQSGSSGTFASAVDRTAARARRVPHRRRCRPTWRSCAPSWPHPDVPAPATRARRCWPRPELAAAARRRVGRAGSSSTSRRRRSAAAAARPAHRRRRPLPVPTGARGRRERRMAGSVVEVKARDGDHGRRRATLLFVVSAMKMETSVDGALRRRRRPRWRALEPWATPSTAGRSWPSSRPPPAAATGRGAGCRRTRAGRRCWTRSRALQAIAHARLAPGSSDPGVVRQRNRGKLTCRERIDAAARRRHASARSAAWRASPPTTTTGDVADFTPANHVGGRGTHRGPRRHRLRRRLHLARRPRRRRDRRRRARYLDRLSIELRTPSIRLLDGSSGGGSVAAMVPEQRRRARAAAKESTGAIKAGRPRVVGGGGSFLPGHLGSTMYTEQLATVPVVNMLLGSVVGIGAAKAVLGHFSVMVRDIAQLFVAGPPVVSHAMGYDITKEDLGGWHIHCRNGSVDNLAETEEEADGDDAALPVLPAVERLRGAAGAAPTDRSRRPPRGGAAHARSRASARRPSTSAAPSR